MSKGKYSPRCPHIRPRGAWNAPVDEYEFKYNCYGKIPEPYTAEEYNDKLHYADYDDEGFDRYGYSAFDENGEFIGHGQGIDRLGYTEFEYMCMSDDRFEDISRYG